MTGYDTWLADPDAYDDIEELEDDAKANLQFDGYESTNPDWDDLPF